MADARCPTGLTRTVFDRRQQADQTPGVTENTKPRTVAGQILRSGQRLAAPVPILRDLTGAVARELGPR